MPNLTVPLCAPAFSYYGKIFISDYAIQDIINIVAQKMLGIDKVNSIRVRRRSSNTKGIAIAVDVVLFLRCARF